MDQVSFSEAEYTVKKRQTRREKFLEQMDGLIPWKRWEKKLARHDAQPRPWSPALPLVRDVACSLHAAVLQPQ